MTSDRCICLGDDCIAAKEAIRAARHTVELVDESHFMLSILRCVRCGQHFLTMFSERIDWADGDDPQVWVAVPVSEDEVEKLRAADVAADEMAVLKIIANDRRYLLHDMPKGGPDRLAWKTGRLFVPDHD